MAIKHLHILFEVNKEGYSVLEALFKVWLILGELWLFSKKNREKSRALEVGSMLQWVANEEGHKYLQTFQEFLEKGR